MKTHIQRKTWFLATVLGLAASITQANDIRVTNVRLVHTDKVNLTTDVRFDISWSNSWRASWEETTTPEGTITVTNWDAAWVFVKYRVLEGADTNWYHARLASGGHRAPSGTTIDVGTNGGGTNVGAFIYRSENGSGGLNLTGVRLRWDYTSNSLTLTNPIDVSVHGIEMVYIPEGRFSVGDGAEPGDEYGSFTDGSWISGTLIPFRITNEAALTITNAAGCLWGTETNGTAGIGPPGVLSNAFPKGYGAFYCMKYEVTQGQYTKYLNQLTETQAGNRYEVHTGTNRQTLGGSWPNYTNGAPDRAACYLKWDDVKAYADWAGLRPMTELEFAKACRGPRTPVELEFTWGSKWSRKSQTNAFFGVDGSGTETAVPSSGNLYANCNYTYNGPMPGPVRVGIYATNNATRLRSGAGYYGMMEMSANMQEPVVTAGALNLNPAYGRVFRGTHGDGVLTSAGAADVPSWPAYSGAGFRGGYYTSSAVMLYTSDRRYGAYNDGARRAYNGCRAVRTAP